MENVQFCSYPCSPEVPFPHSNLSRASKAKVFCIFVGSVYLFKCDFRSKYERFAGLIRLPLSPSVFLLLFDLCSQGILASFTYDSSIWTRPIDSIVVRHVFFRVFPKRFDIS